MTSKHKHTHTHAQTNKQIPSCSNYFICYLSPISKNNSEEYTQKQLLRATKNEICAKWFAIVLWWQDKNVKYHWNRDRRWSCQIRSTHKTHAWWASTTKRRTKCANVCNKIIGKISLSSSQPSFFSFYSPHIFIYNCGKFVVKSASVLIIIIIAKWILCESIVAEASAR